MAKYEPLPRQGHCAVTVGGNVYVWAGQTKDLDAKTRAKLKADLEAFDPLTELWLPTARTTGPAPPGLEGGAIVAVEGGSLYHYGGSNGRSYFSVLSRLDLAARKWARLLSSSSGPMAKAGCGMLCIEGGVLCVWGGCGKPSGPIQPGSTFIKGTRRSGWGWTNELHLFHTKEGGWSTPALAGTRPSPRADFTLTLIRNREAVLFAGYNGREGLNDVHLLDFGQMCWSELVVEGELPLPRHGHAACCLNYNGSHPQLLINGGRDGLNQVLRDCWLLCVVMRRWRKVDLPHGSQPRASHSLTAIALGEGLTVILGFGGFCKWPDNPKTDAELDPYLIAETTVMHFESSPSRGQVVPSSASPSPPSEWRLTGTATSSQLGPGDRVRNKTTQLALREALIKDHSTVNFSPPTKRRKESSGRYTPHTGKKRSSELVEKDGPSTKRKKKSIGGTTETSKEKYLNRRMKPCDVERISKEVLDWRRLAGYMDFDDAKQARFADSGYSDKSVAVIHGWQRKVGKSTATFRALREVALGMEDQKLADHIEEIAKGQ